MYLIWFRTKSPFMSSFVLRMSNVIEFFYFFFGLNRIGAIPIMCLSRHRMLELNHEVKLHKAKRICVGLGEKFDKTHAKSDKLTIDDVISGKVKVEFIETPA